jgi:predicted porin
MTAPKLLALSTLALACGAAVAQSSVTIYGIVDAGVTRVSGIKGGTTKQLSSGIMDGSRLGFRVNEDLGGGWRAIATLEHRLELDNGTGSNRPISGSQVPDRLSQASLLGLPGAFQPVVTAVAGNIGAGAGVNLGGTFWDRQIFAGLVTPFGAVIAGRQYTPAYEILATFDTMQTQSSLAAGQVASLPASVDIRLSNTVAYRAQLGGFSASAMVGAGENSATAGRFTGAMAQFKSGGFAVGAGWNSRDNERGQESLTNVVLGASAEFGVHKVSVMGATVKDNNPSGLSGIAALVTPSVGPANALLIQNAFINGARQDGRLLHAGYRLNIGIHTIYTAYTQYDDKRPANADTRSFGAAYTYSLSKRTDLNFVVTRFDNSGLGQAAPGGAGYLGGVTATAGTDATSVALGLRHRF